jgi:hypothetical protein
MEVITIESSAYKDLLKRIEEIARAVNSPTDYIHNEWVDNETLSRMLNLTTRSLKNYRDRKVLPYSQIEGKIFYRKSDVQSLLERNLKNSKK